MEFLRPHFSIHVPARAGETFDLPLLAGYLLNAPKVFHRRTDPIVDIHDDIPAQRRLSFCGEPGR